MSQHRLPAGERREAILAAVRGVFAEKGFDGVTIRELGEAAGVSEALLYRHFPSKESLYAAICDSCITGRSAGEYKQILTLEPSSSTLVLLTHFLVSKMVFETTEQKKAKDLLVVRSLLGDGEFTRAMHKQVGAAWHRKFRESLAACRKAGDMIPGEPDAELSSWLAHAVALGMMLFLRPGRPVVDCAVSRAEITERCVRFVLLGAGMKPGAIRRAYNAKALVLLGAG